MEWMSTQQSISGPISSNSWKSKGNCWRGWGVWRAGYNDFHLARQIYTIQLTFEEHGGLGCWSCPGLKNPHITFDYTVGLLGPWFNHWKSAAGNPLLGVWTHCFPSTFGWTCGCGPKDTSSRLYSGGKPMWKPSRAVQTHVIQGSVYTETHEDRRR